MRELSNCRKMAWWGHKERVYHSLHDKLSHHSIIYPKDNIYLLNRLDYISEPKYHSIHPGMYSSYSLTS